jgi:FtsH-binding integral membrane protein
MDYTNFTNRAAAQTGTRATPFDAGLRAYMLKVYNYMAGALALTGAVALFTASSEQMLHAIFGTPLQWVVMLAPLGFMLALSFGVHRMQTSTVQLLFWSFAGVMGLSMASIFLVYTGASIAQTFFVTSASFGALSLYGYVTKKDLTGFGSFLIMGLFGLIIASIVNLFLQSNALGFAISAIGVLIFAGLTAYDTQKIKQTYFMVGGNSAVAGKAAIMGALSLYLDFINLFMMLLRFMGNRR